MLLPVRVRRALAAAGWPAQPANNGTRLFLVKFNNLGNSFINLTTANGKFLRKKQSGGKKVNWSWLLWSFKRKSKRQNYDVSLCSFFLQRGGTELTLEWNWIFLASVHVDSLHMSNSCAAVTLHEGPLGNFDTYTIWIFFFNIQSLEGKFFFFNLKFFFVIYKIFLFLFKNLITIVYEKHV